jgi:hypothetical protein
MRLIRRRSLSSNWIVGPGDRDLEFEVACNSIISQSSVVGVFVSGAVPRVPAARMRLGLRPHGGGGYRDPPFPFPGQPARGREANRAASPRRRFLPGSGTRVSPRTASAPRGTAGRRPYPRLSSSVAARIRADAGSPLSSMMVASVVMASSVYFLAANDMWRTPPLRPTAPRGRPAPLRLPPWLLPEGIWYLRGGEDFR